MQTIYLCCLALLLIVTGVSAGGGRHRDRNNGTRGAGGNRDERALSSFMHRVALGKALSCQSDADCGARGNKCVVNTLQLCGRPAVADIFKESEAKPCNGDSDCHMMAGAKKMASRCSKGKCDLCAPKVCQTDSDCCASGHGKAQKCAKIAGYPEKRCWDACSAKTDCSNAMGLGNMKINCVEGVCQKRNRERKGKTVV